MLNIIRKNRMKTEEGFTLIELLITVVILAVIMGIAIPIYVNNKKSADDAAAKSEVVSIARAIDSGIGTGTLTQGDPAGTVQITSPIVTQSQKQSVGAALVFINSSTNAWCASEGKYNETSLSGGVVASNSKHCTDAQTLAAGVGGGGGGGGGGGATHAYFIVEDGQGNIFYSSDGIAWALSNASSGGSPTSLASNDNGTFVSLLNGNINFQYSTDHGATWSNGTLPQGGNYNSIAYAGGQFIAVDEVSNNAIKSSDGITWTVFSMPVSTGSGWQAIGGHGSTFVALDNGHNHVTYSTNGGSTWSPLVATAGNHNVFNIPYAFGNFYLGDSAGGNMEYTSDNGATWNSQSLGSGNWADGGGGASGVVIAQTATTSSAVEYSVNGTSWSTSALPSLNWSTGDPAATDTTIIVPDGSGNGVAVSTDGGATWTANLLPTVGGSPGRGVVSAASNN